MMSSHRLDRVLTRRVSMIGALCAVSAMAGCADVSRPSAPHVGSTREAGGVSDRQRGSTFAVNSVTDAVDAAPGDGVCAAAPASDGGTRCTLRAAVQETNVLPGAQTIVLPAGTYALSIPNPSFTVPSGAESGALDITDALTISGAGVAATTIECAEPAMCRLEEGGESGGLFAVRAASVVIDGVTLARPDAAVNPGTVVTGVRVYSGASLTLRDVTIRGQRSSSAGGALRNDGTLVLERVRLTDNTAEYGGGLANFGTATVTASTFNGNVGLTSGSTISNRGALFVMNSTLSGNVTQGVNVLEGAAALFNSGTATLRSVTVSGNIVRKALACCLVAGIENGGATATLTMSNTIVAGNLFYRIDLNTFTPSDCGGTIASLGFNLVGTTDGCTIVGITASNLVGVDPLLGPLADNGGPTETHALLPGSPAIDAGSPARGRGVPNACSRTDQRGFPRRGRCDIGAFEVQR